MPSATAQERRKLGRVDFQGRIEIEPVDGVPPTASPSLQANSVNLSEEGICVRLQQELAIHSRVTLRVFPERPQRPLECDGRVAWVIQRLDLRASPPFLYDVGVEFINPTARLRQFAYRLGLALKSPARTVGYQPSLQPATLQGRCYVPHLQQESSAARRWHLVVTVEGAPCFSQRYTTRQEALTAWRQFQRRRTI